MMADRRVLSLQSQQKATSWTDCSAGGSAVGGVNTRDSRKWSKMSSVNS